jgi:Flp pilus assembly protein TadD
MMTEFDVNDAITMARRYTEARNYRRAEEVLRDALVHNPHDAQLLTELARVQHVRGDNTAAERSARDALAVEPNYSYAMRVYASVLIELGRQREGLDWARKAVDADPLDYSSHYEYARLLAASGLAADALPVATETLRLAPDDADAHDLMGVVLGKLGRRAESTAEHEKALQLQPGHARALANIAVNRANSRNLSGALAGFTEAGRLDPHLGDEIRRNITATVRQWLSWTTIAAWAALWILLRFEEHGDAPRIVAGLGAVVMLVMFGWLARSLPRPLWTPVLRHRDYRSLKIYLGLGLLVLVVMGAYAVGVPLNHTVLVGTLLATVAVSWLAPRFDQEWLDKVDREKH